MKFDKLTEAYLKIVNEGSYDVDSEYSHENSNDIVQRYAEKAEKPVEPGTNTHYVNYLVGLLAKHVQNPVLLNSAYAQIATLLKAVSVIKNDDRFI
jgi:hypothetical protein